MLISKRGGLDRHFQWLNMVSLANFYCGTSVENGIHQWGGCMSNPPSQWATRLSWLKHLLRQGSSTNCAFVPRICRVCQVNQSSTLIGCRGGTSLSQRCMQLAHFSLHVHSTSVIPVEKNLYGWKPAESGNSPGAMVKKMSHVLHNGPKRADAALGYRLPTTGYSKPM